MTLRRFLRAWTLVAVAQLVWVLGTPAWTQETESPAPSPEARRLGIEETQSGLYRDGYAHLLPWIKMHPEDQQARFYAAWSAAFLGRTYEAADLLVGLREDNPGVQFLWGKLLLDKRDPQGAIDILEPLIGRAPEGLDRDIRRILARAFMEQGRADRAVTLLEGRVGDDPSMALELAQARYENGEVQPASDLLAPYAEIALSGIQGDGPALPKALSAGLVYEYGRMLVNAGEHGPAIPYLEAAVDLTSGCKQCWQHLAQAYAASGRRQEAQSAQRSFEEILRSERSLEEVQRQEAEDQQDPTGRVLRKAKEAFAAGRSDEALGRLREEAQLRPEDPRVFHLAAQILLDNERAADALGLADRAIQMAPDDAEGYYIRGLVFEALGETDRARKDLARALQIAPDHPLASEALGGLPPP